MTRPETGYLGALWAIAMIAGLLAIILGLTSLGTEYEPNPDAPTLIMWAGVCVMFFVVATVGALVLAGVRDLMHKMLGDEAQLAEGAERPQEA